jgi:hypothetical protein
VIINMGLSQPVGEEGKVLQHCSNAVAVSDSWSRIELGADDFHSPNSNLIANTSWLKILR